ncbi:hypothetical protein C0993_007935 [Termitomyces sp. T159_Od127]|nr:hypothetical protein C0993_007935 [Termitomyces sp. T159_Od127]
MRLPSSVFDKALLEDEPFSSGFLALGSGDSRRSRKPEIQSFLDGMASRLKDDEVTITFLILLQILAADAWIRMAFQGHSSEKRRVRPGSKTRRVFVKFYWNLSEHNPNRKEDSAANFLRQELSSRGYDYTPVETKATKKEALGVKHRFKSIRTSGAGFQSAQVLSDGFSSPLKVDNILQTKSSMSPETLPHSPVARSRQGIGVRITSELPESPRKPAIWSFDEENSAVRDSTDLPPPVMDVCAAPIQENKPIIHHERDGIAMPSPEMSSESLNNDLLSSSQTSPSRLVDGFRPEIMPDTALDGDLSTPHTSAPLATYKISSDGTLFESQDTLQTSPEEPAITPTSNILLDETLGTVKPPLPYFPPIWAQVVMNSV